MSERKKSECQCGGLEGKCVTCQCGREEKELIKLGPPNGTFGREADPKEVEKVTEAALGNKKTH